MRFHDPDGLSGTAIADVDTAAEKPERTGHQLVDF